MQRIDGRALALCLALLAAAGLAGCKKPGETGQTTTFEVAEAQRGDIAEALQKDGRVVLRGIQFQFDSATLTPGSDEIVAELAQVMQDNPQMRLAVVGNTDSTGDYKYNIALSQRRAEAITTALTRQYGIAEDRLAAVGVGPLNPVASNATEEGRALNRRVELVLIE